MAIELLNQAWLESEFNQLKVVNHVGKKVIDFENRLHEIFNKLLSSAECYLSDFFTLAVAFHFVDDLLKGQYIDNQCLDSIYVHEREQGAYYRRMTTLFCDVDEVKNKALIFYSEKFKLLEELASDYDLPNVAVPILILEVIEEAKSDFYVQKSVNQKQGGALPLILPKIAKQIRCRHYALDIALVNRGISRKTYKTYNIKQMKEIFSSYHDRLVSEDNIIEDCITVYPFGVYLKSEKYHVKNSAFSFIPQTSTVDEEIKNGNINKTFEYPCEGLIRLVKDSEHSWLKRSVLKHLLCGGTIKILHPSKREKLPNNHPDKYLPPFLLLEPSFSEYILGQFKVIEVHPYQTEVEITLNDLVFIQHEVDSFIKIKHKKIEEKIVNNTLVSVYQNTYISNVVMQVFANSSEETLNDENLKTYETGKKVIKRLKKFSTEGAKAKQEQSSEQWQPLLDAAYKKVSEAPSKKWSANHLAETIITKYPNVKKSTFRRKLPKDKRIKPFLINGKNKK